MARHIAIALLSFFTLFQSGSTQNWSEDIAPIFYEHCAGCHHEGGIAPFELITYDQVMVYKNVMHDVIVHREMPPWPADPAYRHFADELYLSTEEIEEVEAWIENYFASGDLDEVPEPPVYGQEASLLESIDYVVEIEPYQLQYNTDEYRWFVVETDFTETVYISHLEVIAGLDNVVHHVDLAYDLTNVTLLNDLADPLPGFNSSTGGPNYNKYINAWQPGGNVATYPEDWGIAVPPGADFVVEIHYGPGGQGSIDSTKMNLQFIKNPDAVRPVQVGWLLSDSAPILLDGPLVIPANEVVSFHQRSAPLANDMSLISICPHMHFLGKSYKVWAETPAGEIIPLIDIPHWDFHWQRYFEYPQILKLPKGSVIESEGWFDNTTANHDNPNSPPQTAYKGTKTTDEMFLCYFIYADYQAGDENIVIDSSFVSPIHQSAEATSSLELFPNPGNNTIYLTGELPQTEDIEIRLVNMLGQEFKINYSRSQSVELEVQIDISTLEDGCYYIIWEAGTSNGVNKFVKSD